MLPDPQRLRIVVISEVRLRSEALARFLDSDSSVSAVRTCADPNLAASVVPAIRANMLLVDAALPGGPAVARSLRDFAPSVRVIVFGVTESEEDIVPWAEAGISGYIPRTARLAHLVPFLLAIVGGEQPITPLAAGQLFRRLARTAGAGAGGGVTVAVLALTRRERRVAELIAAGHSNHEIAEQLNISLATTKSHVHNLLGKLNLRRRSQVAGALLGRGSGLPPRLSG